MGKIIIAFFNLKTNKSVMYMDKRNAMSVSTNQSLVTILILNEKKKKM